MLGSAPRGPAGAVLPLPAPRPGLERRPAGPRPYGALRGSAAFALDRNISYFLWYGGVAGEGLRSVGAGGELPNHELVFYPAHRPPFTGRGIPRVVPAFACLAKMCRSADASSAGGAYGVFLGRQGVSSLYLGVPALPMLAAPRPIALRRGLRFADATWGRFRTMPFATVRRSKPFPDRGGSPST